MYYRISANATAVTTMQMGQFYWDERMTFPSNVVSSACKKLHLRITPVIKAM